MEIMMIKRFALIVALMFMVQAANAEDKVSLSLKLEKGDSYISTIDMTQTNKQTINGEEQVLTQQMLMSYAYNVTSKNKAGEMDIKLTYKHVKVSQDYGHQVTAYDSEKPPDFLDPSMKGLASLPGTELFVKLDSRGKVIEIEGINGMLDKMIAAMEIPNSANKDAILADLRKQFGDDAIRQTIEQITWFYPEKPVAIGESWIAYNDLKAVFPMTTSSTYTLKSSQNGQAQIDLVSDIKSDTTQPISMGQLEMKYDIAGSQDGSMNVDLTSGLPLSSTVNLNYDGYIHVSGVNDDPPQSWPISAIGTVTITFRKQ
jgi:hypothetical protein